MDLKNLKTLFGYAKDRDEDDGILHHCCSSTSLLLQNRLARKGKAILSQGVLVAISVCFIYYDTFHWCRDEFNPSLPSVTSKLENEGLEDERVEFYSEPSDDFVFQSGRDFGETYSLSDMTSDEVMRMCFNYEYYYLFNFVISVMILGPILVGLFHFFHSRCLGARKEFEIDPEVEKFYSMTNAIPLFGTIFEIKVTWKRGNKACLLLGAIIFLFVAGASLALKNISIGIKLASANVLFQFYQQFGEMNEYWVHFYTAIPKVEEEESEIDYLGRKLQQQYHLAMGLGFDKDYEDASKKIDTDIESGVEIQKLLNALRENQDHALLIQQKTRMNMPESFVIQLDKKKEERESTDKTFVEDDVAAIGEGMFDFFLPFLPEEFQNILSKFRS